MPERQRFRVVLAGPEQAFGLEGREGLGQVVEYEGRAMSVTVGL
jgi:hypothetical protein